MKKGPQSMPSSTLTSTILVLAFVSLAIGEKIQLCSDQFATLTQQRNITNCKTLHTLGAELGWNYQNGTNSTLLLEILFGAKLNAPSGWIAWGVNPGKRAEMIGTKAIIGIKNPNDGSLRAYTYDVTSENKRGCRLLPASYIRSLIPNMSVEYDDVSKLHILSARLVLPSSDYNITRLNHVWQVGYAVAGDDQPLMHPTTLENVGSTETMDLITGRSQSSGRSWSMLRSVHGVLNIIGWGTFLPTGVIIARYLRVYPLKFDPTWYDMHKYCQSAGFLVGTAGWIIGLYLGHNSRYYTFHTHRTFGIVIFTFSTIQMLAFRLKPRDTDEYRTYWNMYHHFLGYGLLSIIFINIFKGISILKGGKGWKWAYVGILSLLGAVTLVFEIWTWVKFIRSKFCKKRRDGDKGVSTDKGKEGNKGESTDKSKEGNKGESTEKSKEGSNSQPKQGAPK